MGHVNAEQWLPVLDWEGFYEVSDQGRVRSLDRTIIRSDGKVKRFRGKFLAPQDDGKGYPQVSLSRNAKPRTYHIHRLVLDAFVGPRPEGKETCHGNDVSDDNLLENLRWDYHPANQREMVANGHHYNANKTHCPQDHEYTTANTYVVIRRDGRVGRRCFICKREQARVYQKRKRAGVPAKA